MLIGQRCGDDWLPQMDEDFALGAIQWQAFPRDRSSRCQHKLYRGTR